MKKNNLLYIGIIAISFLWTGTAYISVAYRLLGSYSPEQIDIYLVIIGYMLQALGMLVYGLGVKKQSYIFVNRHFFAVIMLFEAVVISASLLIDNTKIVFSLSFFMNILHGIVAGCYLTQLSAFVPQQHRGSVFGLGYSIGSVGSWVLSLPMKGTFLTSSWVVLVYLLLITFTIFLNTKVDYKKLFEEKTHTTPKPSKNILFLMFGVLLLLSFVKNIGFYFPVADFSNLINLESSRAFYAFGLIVAGIINDKNRRIGAICCVAALSFSIISFALKDIPTYTLAVWILGYIFLGFFSVYRVVAFSDMASGNTILYLGSFGLIAGRIGDSLGTLFGILLGENLILLLVVSSILMIIVIFAFFELYQRIYTYTPPKSNSQEEYSMFVKSHRFTAREIEVFGLVVQGLSNSEISSTLFISEATVKFHIGNLLKKCTCSNRKELINQFENNF